MLIAKVVGYVLQATGSYLIPFLVSGSAEAVAVLAIQLLAPRLDRIENLQK
jgi:ACS family hexuronate transporter-like MFS transporter